MIATPVPPLPPSPLTTAVIGSWSQLTSSLVTIMPCAREVDAAPSSACSAGAAAIMRGGRGGQRALSRSPGA